MNHKRLQFVALWLLLVGLLVILPGAVAQEITPDPQPIETTPDPTIEVVTEQPTQEPTSIPTETVPVETEAEVTETLQPETTEDAVSTPIPTETATQEGDNPDVFVIPLPDEGTPDNPLPDRSGDGGLMPSNEPVADPNAPQRIIVELNVANTVTRNGVFVPQASEIQSVRSTLSSALTTMNANITQSYQLLPYVAMEADQATMNFLSTSPLVRAIYRDEVRTLHLDFSVPLVGAEAVHTQGYDGTGQTIAILDNGIDSSHAFFQNRVVEEACFSSSGNTPYGFATPNCPNGSTTQYGAGAASPSGCIANANDPSININVQTCRHGTHVAGIAAGANGVTLGGTMFSGVAPDANIIAINVFHTNQSFTGDDMFALDSDIIAGLEYVLALSSTYDIASVNMSLGGGGYYSACDNEFPQYLNIVSQLRAADIAVIVSSGNHGYSDRISAPACLSGAYSVGATTTNWNGQGADQIYGNAANFLDFFAPGIEILSSVPDSLDADGYGVISGTSMAAPHIAGAWAIMRELSDVATVEQIHTVLSGTGVQLTDSRNGLTFPRLELNQAVNQGLLSLNSPIGGAFIGSVTPTFSWDGVTEATYYQVLIYNGDNQVYSEWFSAIDAGCNGGGVCSAQVSNAFTTSSGTYRWYVQPYSEAFTGTNIALPLGGEEFVLQAPELQVPSGIYTGVDGLPTYEWSDVVGATHYRLYIQGASGVIYDEWLPDCGQPTCSIQPPVSHVNGSYSWYMNAWGLEGYSPWSVQGNFVVNAPAPTSPVLVSPVSNPAYDTSTIPLEWQHTTGALWYNIQVLSGATVVKDVWLSVDDLSPNGNNYQTSVDVTGMGLFAWKVRAYGAGGTGAFSGTDNFTINATAVPTGLSADNHNGDVIYHWDHDADVLWYNLLVTNPNNNNAVVVNTWHEVGVDAICSGTCDLHSSNYLPNGDFDWTVRAHSLAGTGAYAAALPISVSTTVPDMSAMSGFQPTGGAVITDYDNLNFQWDDVAGATWYNIWIGGGGTTLHSGWHRGSLICTGGTCTLDLGLLPANGNYEWWIQAYGPSGTGAWAGPAQFEIDVANPVTSITPTLGSVTDVDTNTPSFTWDTVNGAQWYNLVIKQGATTTYSGWISGEDACTSTCTWDDPKVLGNGAYTWYIQAWGPAGYSLMSSETAFNIALAPPQTANLLTPADDATDFGGTMTFSWSTANYGTWYYLRVWLPDDTIQHEQWVDGATCGGGTCTVTVTLPRGDYEWSVATWGPGSIGNDYLNNMPARRSFTLVN